MLGQVFYGKVKIGRMRGESRRARLIILWYEYVVERTFFSMKGEGELRLFGLENGEEEMGKAGERKKAHWVSFFFSCVSYVCSKVTLKYSLTFFLAFCIFSSQGLLIC